MALPPLSIPDYWLEQPPYPFSEDERRACDAQLAAALAHGAATPFAYTLTIPKWRFCCYLAEQHNIALHGSPNDAIMRFEPRQSNDVNEFGAQRAVYAASDGIWPIYFAIVDRAKSPSIINACVRFDAAPSAMPDSGDQETGALPDSRFSAPRYLFSISRLAFDRQPYHNGVVYLLPRTTFVPEPPVQFGAVTLYTAQLASLEAVTPLAKLAVTPEDFPFLAQMRSHDDARLADYAAAMQQGLPWPE